MAAPSITTTVYKYKPYAPWMLGAYAILILLLFVISPVMTPLAVGIAAAVLLLLPIYSAIRPESFFSVRSIDERKLSMDSENIFWDGLTVQVENVTKLSIYLFAFDNFRHTEWGAGGRATIVTEYGDQNKLNFVFKGKEYDFTFYLGDYTEYRTVLQIIQAWQMSGFEVSARVAFDDSYIQRENAYYGH